MTGFRRLLSALGCCAAGFVAAAFATATHDFNADARSDSLWSTGLTGQVVVWLMNGANVIGGGSSGSADPMTWQIVGQRDFNADGRADILWRNNSGQVVVWLMNG